MSLGSRLPLRRVVAEAALEVSSRPVVVVLLFVVCSLMMAVSGVLELSTINNIEQRSHDLSLRGYRSYALTTSGDLGSLSARDCVGGSDLSSVSAATWFVEPETFRAVGPAGPSLEVWRAGGDFVQMAAVLTGTELPAPRASVLVTDYSHPLAADLASIRLTDRAGVDIDVEQVAFDLRPFGASVQSAAVLVNGAPTDGIDLCVLQVEDQYRAQASADLQVIFPSSRGFVHQWILPGSDEVRPVADEFHERPTRLFWLPLALVAAAFWSWTLLLRRQELALYLLSGVGPPGLFQIYGLQWLAVTASGVLCSSAILGGIALAGGTSALSLPWAFLAIWKTFVASLILGLALGFAVSPQLAQAVEAQKA